MSVSEKIKYRLWGKAAGRCQYEGCSKPLWEDDLTKFEFNNAYVAHIIAHKPGGPRGDKILSKQLQSDITNLMLMCDPHHRLIDKDQVAEHPIELLRTMKQRHEDRIELLTSITADKQSHVLLYGANIGQHTSQVNFLDAKLAMIPEWYPADRNPIEFSLRNSSCRDKDKIFWNVEEHQLNTLFNTDMAPKLRAGDIKHLSVFALAPQPLLIKLGVLLSDITKVELYQLHREPQSWKWQDSPDDFQYIIEEPSEHHTRVALNLSLSATIANERIYTVLGNDVSIWTITINNPNNDFLKGKEQLRLFREQMRHVFDKIKATHGQSAELYIFPAAPASLNVEIGRVWQPKADLPLIVYDQNTANGGFNLALRINNQLTPLLKLKQSEDSEVLL